MRENITNLIVIDAINKQEDIGLLYGKLGAAIYSFEHTDAFDSNQKNKKFAENLIKVVYEKINDQMNMSISNGLPGMGLGFNFLVGQSYVEGNIDAVLEDIDNLIYKRIAYINKGDEVSTIGLIEVLIYLSVRFQKGLKNQINRSIFNNLATKIIDLIYINRTEYFYNEPVSFSVYYPIALYLFALGRFYKLGIHTFRIQKILEEISTKLFGMMPLLQANKLTLLYAISSINQILHIEGWQEYAKLLKSHLSIDWILSHEIRNKQIFFTDGAAGIYMLLYFYNRENEDKFEFDEQIFYNKITSSLIWDKFESDSKFLSQRIGLDGYLGLKILLGHLQHKIAKP